ncbi:ferroxidase fet3 [Polyrhizophydium stewartii]|uniref:Ferroxidase fet3 n=1 Tax=Polyrhizophydium stewartii TaxID=2732419 RepID=A0ABR4N3Y7_9FUNG
MPTTRAARAARAAAALLASSSLAAAAASAPALAATALLALAGPAAAAVVELTWSIGWVDNINPDGLAPRRVIGVNGKWPIDPIVATLGDTLVIHATNKLDVDTALHAHGLYQNGTTYYDGAAGITECGIAPGSTFTYNIPIQQTGTYWLHGHRYGQYVDGLRTPLILRPQNQTRLKFDDEIVLSLSDWYHQEHKPLNDFFLSIFNPTGKEPIPDSGLINHSANTVVKVQPNKTYLVRVVTMSALAMFNFYIEGHDLTVVEVDGEDVEPFPAASVPIAAAQRYAFLFTAKNTTDFNYRIHADMDMSMFDSPPASLNPFVNATLQYSPTAPMFAAPADQAPDPTAFDQTQLVPVTPIAPYSNDQSVRYDTVFQLFDDGANHGTFNETIYRFGDVPSVLTAMTMGNLATDPRAYNPFNQVVVAGYMKGIEIILNNMGQKRQAYHLHGHKFQVVAVGSGVYDPIAGAAKIGALKNPVRRDTVVVPTRGYAVLRFYADNPGVWFFHCHVEWHLEAGLASLFVEAPLEMQKKIKVPNSINEQCLLLGKKVSGNAMGYNDTTTFPGLSMSHVYPTGFGAKGVVALMGCIISALIGLVTVVWYASFDDSIDPSSLE